MIQIQRLIKYFAVAFAVFLIVNIIFILITLFSSLVNIFDEDNVTTSTKLESLNVSKNITVLDIDVNAANIYFKEDYTFKIETNNEYITYKYVNERLVISEKKRSILKLNDNNDLVVYVPSDYVFELVKIDAGVGVLEVDELNTKILELDLGAGKVNVNNLLVINKTEIDGGAGEVNINNGSLTNLDLDMGVGNLNLSAKIFGKSDIDAGVGKISMNLVGNLNDYRIKLNKGIGTSKIQGLDVANDTFYGSGINDIYIDGGIGSINIDFIN